ncbi:hypothetical protein SAMN05216225_105814 [Ornithinibacillus halophilus]|uniref:DUF327 domain-containing protein n=2 Tax=Ornithinibacillus halophilus TaxID=930117 RepID=A0A1M5MGA8_9BACI|nr:hypothetical protein SAMN05216225_105814 [Ornithinibacillus halophilus]
MKISQDVRTKVDSTSNQLQKNIEGNKSFQNIVQSQANKMQQAELNRLIQDITAQGNKLARFRSFQDLAKFKRLVKGFLKEAVSNGLELENSHSYSFTGSSQKLSVVKVIDEKLIELTEGIMNQEKKSVDLLGLIGEIKGLLVNLYT